MHCGYLVGNLMQMRDYFFVEIPGYFIFHQYPSNSCPPRPTLWVTEITYFLSLNLEEAKALGDISYTLAQGSNRWSSSCKASVLPTSTCGPLYIHFIKTSWKKLKIIVCSLFVHLLETRSVVVETTEKSLCRCFHWPDVTLRFSCSQT